MMQRPEDEDHRASGHAAPAPGSPSRSVPMPVYPTGKLLNAIGVSAAVLLGLWTVLRYAAELDVQVFRGGILGLSAATVAHVAGALFGAALAASKGSASAYLASTLVRFLLTPVFAVSLYFLLPVKPQPVLVGAAVGYLLILVADIATMLKAMQRPQ